MKLSSTLGVLVLAAALGALAGGAVSFVGQSRADAGASGELLERLDELRDDVEGLRDSVRESKNGVADLEGRLISAEMDLRRMLEEAQTAAAAAPPEPPGWTTGGPIVFEPGVAGKPGAVNMPGEPGTVGGFRHVSEDAAVAAREAAEAMRARFARSMELRALPEEQRWQKAEEDLGLTTAQLDEIKSAKTDFDAAMKDAITSTSSTTSDGASMTFRTVDGTKMRAARNALDDRVDRVLNTEQKERWESEGWKGALTGSGGPAWAGVRHRSDGADGGDAEVISTGVISIDVETTNDDDR